MITEAISFAESNSKCRDSLLPLRICNCRVLSHKIAIYVSNYCQKVSQRRTRKVQESEDSKESSEMLSIAQDKYITVMTSAVRIACTLFTLSHINTQSWMGQVFMGPKSFLGSYKLSIDAAWGWEFFFRFLATGESHILQCIGSQRVHIDGPG